MTSIVVVAYDALAFLVTAATAVVVVVVVVAVVVVVVVRSCRESFRTMF
jgi:hypothetical protein